MKHDHVVDFFASSNPRGERLRSASIHSSGEYLVHRHALDDEITIRLISPQSPRGAGDPRTSAFASFLSRLRSAL